MEELPQTGSEIRCNNSVRVSKGNVHYDDIKMESRVVELRQPDEHILIDALMNVDVNIENPLNYEDASNSVGRIKVFTSPQYLEIL